MWNVITTDTFDNWFQLLDDTDKTSVLASLILLQEEGPQLARPIAEAEYRKHLQTLENDNG